MSFTRSRIGRDGWLRSAASTISQQSFYLWKKKYAGLGLNELRELRQLLEENGKLKRLVADLSLDRNVLQEIVAKKLGSIGHDVIENHYKELQPWGVNPGYTRWATVA